MGNTNCKNPNCELYPSYGVGPHNHNLNKTGSFIGSTVLKDKKDWPHNYFEDPECPGLGTWTCPDCTPIPTDNEKSEVE